MISLPFVSNAVFVKYVIFWMLLCSIMIFFWLFPSSLLLNRFVLIVTSLLNAILRTVILLFPKISFSTRRMFTPDTIVGWTWTCGRFETSLQSSENLFYQSQTHACDRICFQYRIFNLRRNSSGFPFTLTMNLMIRVQRCSTLGVTKSESI
jgi:hypothetical protein